MVRKIHSNAPILWQQKSPVPLLPTNRVRRQKCLEPAIVKFGILHFSQIAKQSIINLSYAFSNHCQVGPALQRHRNDGLRRLSLQPRRPTAPPVGAVAPPPPPPRPSPAAPCEPVIETMSMTELLAWCGMLARTHLPIPSSSFLGAGLGLTPPQSATLRSCSCCQYTLESVQSEPVYAPSI